MKYQIIKGKCKSDQNIRYIQKFNSKGKKKMNLILIKSINNINQIGGTTNTDLYNLSKTIDTLTVFNEKYSDSSHLKSVKKYLENKKISKIDQNFKDPTNTSNPKTYNVYFFENNIEDIPNFSTILENKGEGMEHLTDKDEINKWLNDRRGSIYSPKRIIDSTKKHQKYDWSTTTGFDQTFLPIITETYYKMKYGQVPKNISTMANYLINMNNNEFPITESNYNFYIEKLEQKLTYTVPGNTNYTFSNFEKDYTAPTNTSPPITNNFSQEHIGYMSKENQKKYINYIQDNLYERIEESIKKSYPPPDYNWEQSGGKVQRGGVLQPQPQVLLLLGQKNTLSQKIKQLQKDKILGDLVYFKEEFPDELFQKLQNEWLDNTTTTSDIILDEDDEAVEHKIYSIKMTDDKKEYIDNLLEEYTAKNKVKIRSESKSKEITEWLKSSTGENALIKAKKFAENKKNKKNLVVNILGHLLSQKSQIDYEINEIHKIISQYSMKAKKNINVHNTIKEYVKEFDYIELDTIRKMMPKFEESSKANADIGSFISTILLPKIEKEKETIKQKTEEEKRGQNAGKATINNLESLYEFILKQNTQDVLNVLTYLTARKYLEKLKKDKDEKKKAIGKYTKDHKDEFSIADYKDADPAVTKYFKDNQKEFPRVMVTILAVESPNAIRLTMDQKKPLIKLFTTVVKKKYKPIINDAWKYYSHTKIPNNLEGDPENFIKKMSSDLIKPEEKDELEKRFGSKTMFYLKLIEDIQNNITKLKSIDSEKFFDEHMKKGWFGFGNEKTPFEPYFKGDQNWREIMNTIQLEPQEFLNKVRDMEDDPKSGCIFCVQFNKKMIKDINDIMIPKMEQLKEYTKKWFKRNLEKNYFKKSIESDIRSVRNITKDGINKLESRKILDGIKVKNNYIFLPVEIDVLKKYLTLDIDSKLYEEKHSKYIPGDLIEERPYWDNNENKRFIKRLRTKRKKIYEFFKNLIKEKVKFGKISRLFEKFYIPRIEYIINSYETILDTLKTEDKKITRHDLYFLINHFIIKEIINAPGIDKMYNTTFNTLFYDEEELTQDMKDSQGVLNFIYDYKSKKKYNLKSEDRVSEKITNIMEKEIKASTEKLKIFFKIDGSKFNYQREINKDILKNINDITQIDQKVFIIPLIKKIRGYIEDILVKKLGTLSEIIAKNCLNTLQEKFEGIYNKVAIEINNKVEVDFEKSKEDRKKISDKLLTYLKEALVDIYNNKNEEIELCWYFGDKENFNNSYDKFNKMDKINKELKTSNMQDLYKNAGKVKLNEIGNISVHRYRRQLKKLKEKKLGYLIQHYVTEFENMKIKIEKFGTDDKILSPDYFDMKLETDAKEKIKLFKKFEDTMKLAVYEPDLGPEMDKIDFKEIRKKFKENFAKLDVNIENFKKNWPQWTNCMINNINNPDPNNSVLIIIPNIPYREDGEDGDAGEKFKEGCDWKNYFPHIEDILHKIDNEDDDKIQIAKLLLWKATLLKGFCQNANNYLQKTYNELWTDITSVQWEIFPKHPDYSFIITEKFDKFKTGAIKLVNNIIEICEELIPQEKWKTDIKVILNEEYKSLIKKYTRKNKNFSETYLFTEDLLTNFPKSDKDFESYFNKYSIFNYNRDFLKEKLNDNMVKKLNDNMVKNTKNAWNDTGEKMDRVVYPGFFNFSKPKPKPLINQSKIINHLKWNYIKKRPIIIVPFEYRYINIIENGDNTLLDNDRNKLIEDFVWEKKLKPVYIKKAEDYIKNLKKNPYLEQLGDITLEDLKKEKKEKNWVKFIKAAIQFKFMEKLSGEDNPSYWKKLESEHKSIQQIDYDIRHNTWTRGLKNNNPFRKKNNNPFRKKNAIRRLFMKAYESVKQFLWYEIEKKVNYILEEEDSFLKKFMERKDDSFKIITLDPENENKLMAQKNLVEKLKKHIQKEFGILPSRIEDSLLNENNRKPTGFFTQDSQGILNFIFYNKNAPEFKSSIHFIESILSKIKNELNILKVEIIDTYDNIYEKLMWDEIISTQSKINNPDQNNSVLIIIPNIPYPEDFRNNSQKTTTENMFKTLKDIQKLYTSQIFLEEISNEKKVKLLMIEKFDPKEKCPQEILQFKYYVEIYNVVKEKIDISKIPMNFTIFEDINELRISRIDSGVISDVKWDVRGWIEKLWEKIQKILKDGARNQFKNIDKQIETLDMALCKNCSKITSIEEFKDPLLRKPININELFGDYISWAEFDERRKYPDFDTKYEKDFHLFLGEGKDKKTICTNILDSQDYDIYKKILKNRFIIKLFINSTIILIKILNRLYNNELSIIYIKNEKSKLETKLGKIKKLQDFHNLIKLLNIYKKILGTITKMEKDNMEGILPALPSFIETETDSAATILKKLYKEFKKLKTSQEDNSPGVTDLIIVPKEHLNSVIVVPEQNYNDRKDLIKRVKDAYIKYINNRIGKSNALISKLTDDSINVNKIDKINVNNIDTIQETINQIKKILNEFEGICKSIETRIQEFEEFLTKYNELKESDNFNKSMENYKNQIVIFAKIIREKYKILRNLNIRLNQLGYKVLLNKKTYQISSFLKTNSFKSESESELDLNPKLLKYMKMVLNNNELKWKYFKPPRFKSSSV